MAKMSTGARVINQPQTADEAWIVQTVQTFAQKAGIKLNRKELSELAIHDPSMFETICRQAKAAVA